MSMLSDTDIHEAVMGGIIGLHPYDQDLLSPASYDVLLDPHVRLMDPVSRPLDVREIKSYTYPHTISLSGLTLRPGQFILASTVEHVKIPLTLVARVEGKSSLARIGLAVHVTAGFIDPGFVGQVTLEIVNLAPRPIVLRPRMRIAQLAFTTMLSPPSRGYGEKGHYQDQKGPQESRYKVDDE